MSSRKRHRHQTPRKNSPKTEVTGTMSAEKTWFKNSFCDGEKSSKRNLQLNNRMEQNHSRKNVKLKHCISTTPIPQSAEQLHRTLDCPLSPLMGEVCCVSDSVESEQENDAIFSELVASVASTPKLFSDTYSPVNNLDHGTCTSVYDNMQNLQVNPQNATPKRQIVSRKVTTRKILTDQCIRGGNAKQCQQYDQTHQSKMHVQDTADSNVHDAFDNSDDSILASLDLSKAKTEICNDSVIQKNNKAGKCEDLPQNIRHQIQKNEDIYVNYTDSDVFDNSDDSILASLNMPQSDTKMCNGGIQNMCGQNDHHIGRKCVTPKLCKGSLVENCVKNDSYPTESETKKASMPLQKKICDQKNYTDKTILDVVNESMSGNSQGNRKRKDCSDTDEHNKCRRLNAGLNKQESTDKSIIHSSGTVKHLAIPNVTPTNIRHGSFKNRLKSALQKNAKCTTPQNSRAQLQKAESVHKAHKESVEIQQQGSEFDIGPFYGLPSKVQEMFAKHRGISDLYDWQKECLTLKGVQEGKNLIYSLPTSGGKTLVAEILILRELLCKKRDALLILPFVSIVQEKVRNLSSFAVDLDFLVEEYAAGKGQIPPRKRRKRKSLYVATIEKANSLVNSLIELQRIQDIGLVVVDELHMLGEGGSRGATLEMTLAKLMHTNAETQIVGMSATLNNIEDLQQFMKAEVYSNDFRPVKLQEYVKLEDQIYEINPKALCPVEKLVQSRVATYPYSKSMNKVDPDQICGLVSEVIPDYSCLLFCPTKKNCENVALMLCKMMPRHLTSVKQDQRATLVSTLVQEGNGEICPVLRKTIPFGVAYHHSGLTTDERKLIEEAYSDGVLCLLTCTSTLAAGVNLPAKRVILRSPYVGDQFISRSQYKQMVGRAGRAGIDSTGESILVVSKADKNKVLDLIGGPFDSCRSSLLYEEQKGIRKLLLTTIGLKITPNIKSAVQFLETTLFAVQSSQFGYNIPDIVQTGLQQLMNLDLITQKVNDTCDNGENALPVLEVTKLGKASYKGSIDLDRAPRLYADLCVAQESLVLVNYLHLLYLVTPYDMVTQVKLSWMIYFQQFSTMGPSEVKVPMALGITESYLAKKASGQRTKQTVEDLVVRRFYLSLILYDLWQQKTIWDVAHKYDIPRGFIQNLLTGAATFASCVAHFCQELEEFWAYQDLFANFVKKLSYCVTMELIPLMEIPGVKQGRAKQLYNAGFKTLQHIAHADPEDLVKSIEHMPRKAAKQIVTAAQMLLNDKAEALREEAEELVTMPTDVSIGDETLAAMGTDFSSQENNLSQPLFSQ